MINTAKKLFSAFIALLLITVAVSVCARMIFPVKYKDIIAKYCKSYSVDPATICALIKAESNFKETAQSHAGAKGLMQLTDHTFDFCLNQLNLKDSDVFSPETNIRCGIWYLSYLLEKYDGDEKNAIAAYNAGETNVDRWLSDKRYSTDGKNLLYIPFPETRNHIRKIQKYSGIYQLIYYRM